ncbi:MAG: hypothetical protein M3Z05_05520, partial [Gemmatimonadota bacterium]|nr:hypothetical protein [Gemmatimonadota bacterium]
MSLTRLPTASVLLLAAFGACAGDAPRSTNNAATAVGSTRDTTSAGGNVTAAGQPAPLPDAAAPAAAGASSSSTAAVADTPVDTTTPHLIPGRSKMDATSFAATVRAGVRAAAKWPAGPALIAGALLPANRIVAYYGNPHSKKMGVLGEYPEEQMLGMLDKTVAAWKAADPRTPVIPAIHLVTVVAQGAPGPDGMWRRREDPSMIEKTYQWAKARHGLLILDIQASHSTLQQELPRLLPYLARPDVHLGVDPEFYMHYDREGLRPSSKIGTMMAADVNYVIKTLDSLVAANKLPPKILVVHRFTSKMVPDAENIRPTSRVQVVMDMDGWGPPWLKFDSYRDYIVNHPVEFTGFKIFYHNDTKKGDALLTPGEV